MARLKMRLDRQTFSINLCPLLARKQGRGYSNLNLNLEDALIQIGKPDVARKVIKICLEHLHQIIVTLGCDGVVAVGNFPLCCVEPLADALSVPAIHIRHPASTYTIIDYNGRIIATTL